MVCVVKSVICMQSVFYIWLLRGWKVLSHLCSLTFLFCKQKQQRCVCQLHMPLCINHMFLWPWHGGTVGRTHLKHLSLRCFWKAEKIINVTWNIRLLLLFCKHSTTTAPMTLCLYQTFNIHISGEGLIAPDESNKTIVVVIFVKMTKCHLHHPKQ